MKLKLEIPVKEIHGSIDPQSEVYYRVLNGVQIMQRKPRMRSPKRIAACIAFGEKYGKGRARVNPRSNPEASTEHLLPK